MDKKRLHLQRLMSLISYQQLFDFVSDKFYPNRANQVKKTLTKNLNIRL